MPAQETASTIAAAAPDSRVDRRLLIDGRLITPFGGFKQSGVGREMGVAGLEEFLERKTFAVPAVLASAGGRA